MVPVQVGDDDDIGPAQRLAIRPGNDPAQGTDPVPNGGIGQDGEPVELDQARGVPEELDLHPHAAPWPWPGQRQLLRAASGYRRTRR